MSVICFVVGNVCAQNVSDITGRDSSMKQKLYLLRHSLLHVICTLHSHHMCLLLQIFSVDLQKDLLRVQTVETLIQGKRLYFCANYTSQNRARIVLGW